MSKKSLILKAIFLCTILSLCTGCNSKLQEKHTASKSSESTLPIITIYAYCNDNSLRDADTVVAAINEYIRPLIQAQITVEFMPFGSYRSQLDQILDSDDPLDLFLSSKAFDLHREGLTVPMNSLLEKYGGGILEALEPEYRQLGHDMVSGDYYGIPTCFDYATRLGIEYRKDIAEKYHIDMSKIHTLNDLTDVFHNLKQADPQIHPLISASAYHPWDSLGDNFGVLMQDAPDTQLVNLYESEEYLEYLLLLRSWYQNGYLYDKTANPGSDAYYLRSDEYFAAFVSAKPGYLVQEERYIGKPLDFLPLAEDFITTDSASKFLWVIPEKSRYKEKAMQFLNLLYQDPVVINLWIYGLEGIHYVIKDQEKGIIGFPDEINYATSGFAPFMGFACGNQYLSYVWEGNSESIWSETQSFNDQAQRSRAFGFHFDSSSVINEVNACKIILAQYEPGFMAGVYDLEEVLPVFQDALRKAGIETIIKEKQRQLDAWRLLSYPKNSGS